MLSRDLSRLGCPQAPTATNSQQTLFLPGYHSSHSYMEDYHWRETVYIQKTAFSADHCSIFASVQSSSAFQVRHLQHSQSADNSRDQSDNLATSQRRDHAGSILGVGRGVGRGAVRGSGGGSGDGDAHARTSVQERGVGHHVGHLGSLLRDLSLELGDLLSGVI